MEIVDNTDWTLRYQSHGFGQTEPVHRNCKVSLFVHPIYLITNISPVIDLLKKHTQAPAKKINKQHFIQPSLDRRWGNLTWVNNGHERFPGSASTSRNKDLCAGKYPIHHVFNKHFTTSMRRKWQINVSSSAQESNIKINCASLNPTEQDWIKKVLIPVQKCRMFIIRRIKLILFGECISHRYHPVAVLNYIQRFCKKLSPRNMETRWR